MRILQYDIQESDHSSLFCSDVWILTIIELLLALLENAQETRNFLIGLRYQEFLSGQTHWVVRT